MATLAYGRVVQVYPSFKKEFATERRKKKSQPKKLSAYAFLHSRLSQVKSLGIQVLQMPGPKWHLSSGGSGDNRASSNGLIISGGIHGNGPRYTPSELSYFNQIAQISEALFLSSAAAVTVDKVLTHGITCIINVTIQIPTLHMPKVESIHLRLEDDPRTRLNYYFDPVADKIKEVQDRGGRTLLHCVAGVSRSASLTIAYLVKHKGMTLRQAYLHVKSRRPIIRPNLGFWRQLMDYEKKQRGCSTVAMINSPIGQIPDVYKEDTRALTNALPAMNVNPSSSSSSLLSSAANTSSSSSASHGFATPSGGGGGVAAQYSPPQYSPASSSTTTPQTRQTTSQRLPVIKEQQRKTTPSSSGLVNNGGNHVGQSSIGHSHGHSHGHGRGKSANGNNYFSNASSSSSSPSASNRYSKSQSFYF